MCLGSGEHENGERALGLWDWGKHVYMFIWSSMEF